MQKTGFDAVARVKFFIALFVFVFYPAFELAIWVIGVHQLLEKSILSGFDNKNTFRN